MATQVITNHHHHHVTFSGSSQGLRHSSPGPTTSISTNGIVNGTYPGAHASIAVVEHDNPFRPGSELIEDAENILKNVTIVGSQVMISGSNDSGIVAASPSRQNVGSPAANGSALHTTANDTHLQCSTILSTTSSTPAGQGQLRVEDPFTVQRASPESLRPESPPLRAEHVMVTTQGDVKASPKSPGARETDPSNPFKDQKLIDEVSVAVAASNTQQQPGPADAKDKKKKKKKKCSIL